MVAVAEAATFFAMPVESERSHELQGADVGSWGRVWHDGGMKMKEHMISAQRMKTHMKRY